MLYRVRIDLMFPLQVDGDEVWAKLKDYFQIKTVKSLANEKSYIEYHKCFHDEGLPCELIERVEKQ